MTHAGANGPPGRSLLRLEKVEKRFAGFAALADITIAVEPRCFLVLLGPSGSGKTTLLRSIAGIERISAGRILLNDQVVDDGKRQTPPERRDLAMVFQDYALWPHMTARQNVAYALRRGKPPAGEAQRRVADLLSRVGLGALGDRYPSQLSGGEQQRVALARALVSGPSLLLFDEPLSNLDANLRELMRAEIATLVREAGATAIYITHDQAEAFALADIVGVLNRGRLVQVGAPEDIYTTPATPFVARLTGLAGELRCMTTAGNAVDTVSVAYGEATLRARAGEAVGPANAARMLVRPTAVQLLTSSNPDAPLRGRVRDVAFVGRGYEHVIELPDGATLTGVFAEQRFARGDNVHIRLDARRCVVFSEASCAT